MNNRTVRIIMRYYPINLKNLLYQLKNHRFLFLDNLIILQNIRAVVVVETEFHENVVRHCLEKSDLEEYIAAFESNLELHKYLHL